MNNDIQPPRWADRFLSWFCSEKVLETLQGDLHELYGKRRAKRGKLLADLWFVFDVIDSCRPFAFRKRTTPNLIHYGMYKSYFKVGWRNLAKNKGYSVINVGGLAIGMTVAMLIGLWVYDELSYDTYHEHYNSIGQLWGGGTNPETSVIEGSVAMQFPVGAVLKNAYPQYFEHILMAFWFGNYTLSTAEQKVTQTGEFIEPGGPEMLSLKMLKGSYESLKDPHSIILSQSAAHAIFGDEDAMNKSMKIDNLIDVQVTGIYEDIPGNNRFGEVKFFSTWTVWVNSNEWIKNDENSWDDRSFNIYVQLRPGVTMEQANEGIHDLYVKNLPKEYDKVVAKYKAYAQIIPMSTWHLYSELKDGKPAAGRITFVWLFSIVGGFVLILACINFVNLSTARSEKRAREVGVRKAVGSGARQLRVQFLSESFLVVVLAFLFALGLLIICQPSFNQLTGKEIHLPFDQIMFWLLCLCFLVVTGLMAGLYPAFYLASFQPAKVLKGVIRSGRFAALPRKILVVTQFTVSVVLIIGTIVVYQQIQHARNRPVGYNREGLVYVSMNDPNYRGKQDAIRQEILNTGVATNVGISSSPMTAVWSNAGGFDWEGKPPEFDSNFAIINVTYDYGATAGWQFIDGRDFSTDFASDTMGIVINETAAKYMNLKEPVGQYLKDEDGSTKWPIVGVIKDIVMESPYQPIQPSLFFLDHNNTRTSQLTVRIRPDISAAEALPKIENVLKRIVPSAIFDYKFMDQEYATKFSQEERIGKLSTVFGVLAVLISCLGLFGLSSFVAEQRTKEIGIRKVVGASVFTLWKLLSRDFVMLVFISCVLAIPIAYYYMHEWLQNYQYKTEITASVFVYAIGAALLITLLTVSYQAIRAAKMNPVKSLRSE